MYLHAKYEIYAKFRHLTKWKPDNGNKFSNISLLTFSSYIFRSKIIADGGEFNELNKGGRVINL